MKSAEKRILVVGTTSDYIDLLESRFSSRLIFLTDLNERSGLKKFYSENSKEIVFDLEDYSGTLSVLKKYLFEHNICLTGVVCFDCESLALTSVIADKLSLSFPSLESVLSCRSKYALKDVWSQKGVGCPLSALIYNQQDVREFFNFCKGPVVIKPLTGSGSELVFLCEDIKSCLSSYQVIIDKLQNHDDRRMYSAYNVGQKGLHPAVVMEEYIPGDEYSCDFVFQNGRVDIIRFARKIVSRDGVFGTSWAYVVPAVFEENFDKEAFVSLLKRACVSLGLNRTMGMVDFIINKNEVFLLELTPRIGGDCLPALIQASCNWDIFKAVLDFSEGKSINIPEAGQWAAVVGLQIFADQKGWLRNFNITAVKNDKRFDSCYVRCVLGDYIILPPENYNLRKLGYVIFRPYADISLEDQCEEILAKIVIEIETHEQVPTAF